MLSSDLKRKPHYPHLLLFSLIAILNSHTV